MVLIAWPVLSVWAVALMNSLQFQSVMLYDGTRSFSFLCRLPALHLGFLLLYLHLVIIMFIIFTVSEAWLLKLWKVLEKDRILRMLFNLSHDYNICYM